MGNQVIFSAALTGAFQPTDPFVLAEDGEYAVLDFEAVFSVGGTIEWYLEFCHDDPNDVAADWHREVAQESTAGGVVAMPIVVRTLQAAGGGSFTVATHRLSVQLVRKHKFCRLQVRVAGGGTVTSLDITNPFGIPTS